MDETDNLIQNWPRVLLGFVVLVLVLGVVIASARQYLRRDQTLPGDITPPGATTEEGGNKEKEDKAGEQGQGAEIDRLPATSSWQTVVVQPGDGWERIANRECKSSTASSIIAAQNPSISILEPYKELLIRCP